ncbi:hypothetical protein LF907_06550, partial [Bifidobacterium pseudolongum]|uniref:hypothetical protein n=1 Tax=Bifidobacterium pseudolongum TaxID=1694 RepID=UPI001F0CE291
SNGPEPARNALIYGKTENNTPDTPTATTANQQHNQHILTYMPMFLNAYLVRRLDDKQLS